jgi:hypothetical protein
MKSALLAAVVLAMPLLADAGGKYVVRNGRAVAGGGGGSGHSSGGTVAPAAARGGGGRSSGGSPVYGGGGQAFLGGASRSGGGHQSFFGGARRLGNRAYRIPQRALESDGSGDAPAEPSAEEAPPHFSKPGALIRTAGHRPFEYADAAAPAQRHQVEAGAIALNERYASHVNRSHGLRVGARDTPPSCTPGTNGCGGGSGGNAITPNAVINNEGDVRNNGAHDNQNGGSGGNGRGNGGFGGGTGFDPAF